MHQFEYKVVPFIGRIRSGLFSTQNVTDVANQLTQAISQMAAIGWSFHSINTVNIQVKPGCIASLFGRAAFFMQFDQMVFSRAVTAGQAAGSISAASATLPATGAPPPIPTRTLVYTLQTHTYLGVFVEDDGQHIIVRRENGELEKYVSSTVDLVQE